MVLAKSLLDIRNRYPVYLRRLQKNKKSRLVRRTAMIRGVGLTFLTRSGAPKASRVDIPDAESVAPSHRNEVKKGQLMSVSNA
jgi:hypothetical protein